MNVGWAIGVGALIWAIASQMTQVCWAIAQIQKNKNNRS